MMEFEHAVVGGGIVGSWTALQLVRLGKKVLLIEQFSQPHTRGSSHGASRIIRSCYPEQYFGEMMPYAVRMWNDTQAEIGKALMVNTGILCLSKPCGAGIYDQILKNMDHYSPGCAKRSDPKIDSFVDGRHIKYDDLHGVCFDTTGGILLAHRSVLAIQDLFRKMGGHLWDESPVDRLEPQEDAVTVHLKSGKGVTVKSVVVCAGAWSKSILEPLVSLPTQAGTVRVFYWKPKEEGAYSEKSGFPCFIDISPPEVYGFPSYEYPGLIKVCIHAATPCDPDNRDQTKFDSKLEQKLKDYVKERLPLLEPEPAIVETCMYTLTPDETFLIDTVPGHKNIVIGTGFSGGGFKTSPAVGRLLSEMATGQKPFMDISPFSLSRFAKKD